MSKIYNEYAIEDKIAELNAAGESSGADTNLEEEAAVLSYKDVFTDPHYRRASFVGCAMSIF